MSLRSVLKDVAPPLLVRLARAAAGRGMRFEGDYATWDEALQASTGYGNEGALAQVLAGELKVSKGEAVDARDGAVFDAPQYSLPVMAGLARAHAKMVGSTFRVVDLGGAFGGLHRQFKTFLPGTDASWIVVEQPAYVAEGRKYFQSDGLLFCESLAEAFSFGDVTAVLLSSVLQYLQDPGEAITQIRAARVPHVVVDRTPCSALDRDVLVVQRVPARIYKASYPCWIFSRRLLLERLLGDYRLVSDFEIEGAAWGRSSVSFEYCGFILERRT